MKSAIGEIIYVAAVAAAAVLAADRTALEPAWAAAIGAVVALVRRWIVAELAKRVSW